MDEAEEEIDRLRQKTITADFAVGCYLLIWK